MHYSAKNLFFGNSVNNEITNKFNNFVDIIAYNKFESSDGLNKEAFTNLKENEVKVVSLH